MRSGREGAWLHFNAMSAVPVARLALFAIVFALLGGCASSWRTPTPSPDAAAAPPAQWYAPASHHGELGDLAGWWAQFNDPLLDRLIADAQRVSPTVSTARLRIEQSRAARAAAAQTHAQLVAQRAQCESIVKALVALTAQSEPALRDALVASRGVIAQPREIAVPALPGALLQQRPDLASAERDVLAAAANLTEVRIDRLPRIRLNGSVGATRYQGGGFGSIGGAGIPSIDGSGPTWSIGPLSVSMPIFDGGLRAAQVEAARAGLTHAQTQYAATVRRAVEDVEQALVALQGIGERQADAEIAATGYAESLRATDARSRGGLANGFDLEDARRASAQAQLAVIALRRERVTAWISLYRALGGGWGATSPDAPGTDPVATAVPAAVTANAAR